MTHRVRVFPLELLIVQPTSFCNLDCRYCYLPDRSIHGAMSSDTLRMLAHHLFAYTHLRSAISVVWHAGEPLTVPPSFYENAFNVFDDHNVDALPVSHTIQTNATLLNSDWCTLFKSKGVRVGVSIDGPEFLHDRYRLTRRGGGTHAAAMRGVNLLKEHDISFYTICVLTEKSLDFADELYEFFLQNEVLNVGLNIAEIEGVNVRSGILDPTLEIKIRGFFSRFTRRVLDDDFRLRWRELSGFAQMLSMGKSEADGPPQVARAGAIISVDKEGNFATFSPELLGAQIHGLRFVFGNVHRGPFEAMYEHPMFKRIWNDISRGRAACLRDCAYWEVCGGGAPSNKWFENGDFSSTITRYCRVSFQVLPEVLLDELTEYYERVRGYRVPVS